MEPRAVDGDEGRESAGGGDSPILANLYLHYVLDLWVEQWQKKASARGCHHRALCRRRRLGFEHRTEARAFPEELRERLGKFGLELHPEKTRLIEFGRYAAAHRKQRGEGKPETFNFLGFTHIWWDYHQTGNFTVQRKTMGKRLAAKLKEMERNCTGACTPAFRKPASGCGRWCGGFPVSRVRATGDNCKRFAPRSCTLGAGACFDDSQRSRQSWLNCATVSPPCCHRPNSATLPRPALRRQISLIQVRNRVR